jgi:hypothetical protein
MNMYVHVYKVFLQEPLTYMPTCIKCFMMKVCAHVHQIIVMKVCAHGNHMFHFASMRSRASYFIMKVCAHVHQIFIMKICAHVHQMFYHEIMRSHMLICCIIKIRAHVHKMFYNERMRFHMHHIVSLPKYVLTYIVCLIVEVCVRVHLLFSD